jgi:hypothetical protein
MSGQAGETHLYVAQSGTFASLRGPTHNAHEFVREMQIRFGAEMRPATDDASGHDQELQKQSRIVRFRVRPNESKEFPR